MSKEYKNLMSVDINKIYPHPDNPRKNLGDITELTESIKKKGIMQNLTIIPGHWLSDEEVKELQKMYNNKPDEALLEKINKKWTDEGYTLIIGHRRCAAAKEAGLIEVPCKIVEDMSMKEQVSTMLEENMQRNDLTVYEQAQGFQMMLDLGDTEESIAEKTGFSKSTIRHRLNIAKLDQKLLRDKEQDDSFQLSLKDLYELEKVEDVAVRNKILKEARDSRDLIWRAQSAANEFERQKKQKKITDELESMGINKAPKVYASERYSSKWETIKKIELDKKVPKTLKPKKGEQIYYYAHWHGVDIVKKADKKKKVLTPEEQRRNQLDANKKEIKALLDKMTAKRKEFIESIISGRIEPIKQTEEIKDAIWCMITKTRIYIASATYTTFFTGKADYMCDKEELKEAMEKAEELSIIHQMLVIMHLAMKSLEINNYYGVYEPDNAAKLKNGYQILEKYGFSFDSDEELQLIAGTSKLYTKSEGGN